MSDVEERLARLQQRRQPETPAQATAKAGSKRRSPARDTKILTFGASATAMFGMIAAFGIADGAGAADTSTEQTGVSGGVPAVAPAASQGQQVVVIVVDAAAGVPLSVTSSSADGTFEVTVPTSTKLASQAEVAVPVAAPTSTMPVSESMPASSDQTSVVPAPAVTPAREEPAVQQGNSQPAPPPVAAPSTPPPVAVPVAPAAPVELAIPAAPSTTAPPTTVPQGSSTGS